jgi:hypothetical protein
MFQYIIAILDAVPLSNWNPVHSIALFLLPYILILLLLHIHYITYNIITF